MKKGEIKNALKQLDTLPLPDKNAILSQLSEQDAVYQYTATAVPVPRQRRRLKPALALCALVLFVISGFSLYGFSAEGKVYAQAVSFFEEYALSTEGLSRGDIKNVYRDITTGAFRYEKTAAVIEERVNGHASGSTLMPEDLAALWQQFLESSGLIETENGLVSDTGAQFIFDSKYKQDETTGAKVFDYSVFEKYVDGKPVWSLKFTDFAVSGHRPTNGDNLFVFGSTPTLSEAEPSPAYIVYLNGTDGSVLWTLRLDNGFQREYINSITSILPLEEEIVVFSRGDDTYLGLTRLDYAGNVLSFHKSEIGSYVVWDVLPVEDGYLVQLGDAVTGEYTHIVKVGQAASVSNAFVYGPDNTLCYLSSMMYYNGRMYLSGYTVPNPGETEEYGGREDVADIFRHISENHIDISDGEVKTDITNEELTRLLKEHFTAVLFVCDEETGQLSPFHTVKGALGGELSINNLGDLVWRAESFTDAHFSLFTSSHNISGTCAVTNYSFDASGELVKEEATGEQTDFIR